MAALYAMLGPDELNRLLQLTGRCARNLLSMLLCHHVDWDGWKNDFSAWSSAVSPMAKLLVLMLYLSLCTTLTPGPSGPMVAIMATQGAAVASNVWTVTLLVGFAGAVGSTLANLNDYHLFTWMLRHHRIANLRHTRWYNRAEGWVAKSPFLLLTIFNLLPIPVDVVRLLAISYRYGRVPFAAANFLGRFVRFAIIAFVAYYSGWIASVVLLALAIVLGLIKVIQSFWRKHHPQGEQEQAV